MFKGGPNIQWKERNLGYWEKEVTECSASQVRSNPDSEYKKQAKGSL